MLHNHYWRRETHNSNEKFSLLEGEVLNCIVPEKLVTVEVILEKLRAFRSNLTTNGLLNILADLEKKRVVKKIVGVHLEKFCEKF